MFGSTKGPSHKHDTTVMFVESVITRWIQGLWKAVHCYDDVVLRYNCILAVKRPLAIITAAARQFSKTSRTLFLSEEVSIKTEHEKL